MSAVLIKNKEKEEVFNFYQSKSFSIDDLPRELLLKIFDNLSLPELGSCSQVCKKWRTMLGNYGDRLFLKFFKGETVQEKLCHQVKTQKALTEANEKTQLLTDKNISANRKKLFLKIAVVIAFFLIVLAASAITFFTVGGFTPFAIFFIGWAATIAVGILVGKYT